MAFVFEKVPEEDREFFKSMGLKDCWGSRSKYLCKDTEWCADRERNAYLVGIGGGYQDMPYFYDLWWNGYTIRMEMYEGGSGNYDIGVNIVWFIHRIPIPEEIWDHRDEIVQMIKDGFSVNEGWCRKEKLISIDVKIMCEPEIADDYDRRLYPVPNIKKS